MQLRKAALGFLLPLIAAAPALAGEHTLMIFNETAMDVAIFSVSPAGADTWRDDVFGAGYLQAYSRATATVIGPDGQCLYDFRYELTDGSLHRERGIDLCATDAYTIKGY